MPSSGVMQRTELCDGVMQGDSGLPVDRRGQVNMKQPQQQLMGVQGAGPPAGGSEGAEPPGGGSKGAEPPW